MSDESVLSELGHRLARHRINQEFTQADLAKEAGISKRTLERVEAGASTQVSSLIRILRTLGLLEGLEQTVPELGPSPMDLLKLKGKERRRVSKKNRVAENPPKPWTWGG